jgi:transcriptional regulator with XRE-family HTH domain
LRAERALSLRALAEKSGLAVNTLSLIENSKTSPSVSTLQQLALALQVPITSFFGMDAPELRVAFIKSDGRPRALFAHGTLEDLGAGLRYRPIEPLVVTLQPAADSGPHPIVHTGFEFVYCLAGRVQYAIDDHEYLLEPGDSLMFQAHLPHRWHNPGPAVAQAILVLSPSDEWDRPVDRHFLPPVGDGQIEGERLSSPSDAHRRTE